APLALSLLQLKVGVLSLVVDPSGGVTGMGTSGVEEPSVHVSETMFETCVWLVGSTNDAWMWSVPVPPEPVYVNETVPSAAVVQSTGTHVPDPSEFGPSRMLKLTAVPTTGLPLSLTVAVTVWSEPTGSEVPSGARLMSVMCVPPTPENPNTKVLG